MGESSTAASKFPANNTDIPDDSRGEDTRPRGLPRPEEKPTPPHPPPLKRSSTSFSTSVIRNYGDSRERLRAAEWVQTRRSTSSLSRVRAPTTRVCSNAAKIRYLSRGHPHLRLKTDLGFASSRSWFMIRSRWKVSKRCFRLVQVSMKIWNCVLNKYRAISSCI